MRIDRLEIAADLPVHDRVGEYLQVEGFAQVLRLLDHAPRDVVDDARLISRCCGSDNLRPRLWLIAQAVEQDRRGEGALRVLARNREQRTRKTPRAVLVPESEQVDQEKD